MLHGNSEASGLKDRLWLHGVDVVQNGPHDDKIDATAVV